jgi:hypothetical protein
MEIFEESKMFPGEEKYSLTGQIRLSSRSVPANIAAYSLLFTGGVGASVEKNGA